MAKNKKQDNRFFGVLSPAQLAEGITYCYENATSFLEESKMLLNGGKYARSVFLALGCIEEIGNAIILARMAGFPPERQELWNREWENFYRHNYKVAEILSSSKGYKSLLSTVSDRPNIVELSYSHDYLREKSMFVEYEQASKVWNIPLAFKENEAKVAIEMAEVTVEKRIFLKNDGFYSARSFELKREFYKKIYNRLKNPNITLLDFEAMEDLSSEVNHSYFKKLVEEGIVNKSCRMTLGPITFKEYVEMPYELLKETKKRLSL